MTLRAICGFVAMVLVTTAAIVTVFFMGVSPHPAQPTMEKVAAVPAAPAPPDKKSQRSRDMRELHEESGDRALARMEERAGKEPGYARLIREATRESIWKIKSMSDEEKELLWERIQRLKNRIATNTSKGSRP